MEIAFSLGSNLDDRVSHLREAKRQLVAFSDTTLLAQSTLYDTSPVDVAPEYADLHFVNAVLVLDSDRSPQEWLERLQTIESDIGRERDASDRNAPRTIDIDMLYAGDAHFERRDLTLPHPRWATRRFVLEPLAEIRPNHVLPGGSVPVREMLTQLDTDDTCKPMSEEW